jgi:hypothetical protein
MAVASLSVADHPQVKLIIEGIQAKKSLRVIAASVTPPVSAMAIQRFKRHLELNAAMAIGNSANGTTCTSKAWVEREYVDIVSKAKRGKRPDLPTARAALDSIARLNGYDAPRRSESLNLNLHAIGSDALAQQLATALHALPESERKQLLQAEPAIAAEVEDSSE